MVFNCLILPHPDLSMQARSGKIFDDICNLIFRANVKIMEEEANFENVLENMEVELNNKVEKGHRKHLRKSLKPYSA